MQECSKASIKITPQRQVRLQHLSILEYLKNIATFIDPPELTQLIVFLLLNDSRKVCKRGKRGGKEAFQREKNT